MMTERLEAPSDRKIWVMRQSATAHESVSNAVWEDQIGVVNDLELERALKELRYTRSLKIAGDPLVPPDFMHPIISLPIGDFAPDYFELKSKIFVSRRFREAINQPPDVLQFLPVEVLRGSADAYCKEYTMLRILAYQPALDWERSVYKREEITNRRTGEQLTSIYFIDQFVPLESIVPRTEIFRASEHKSTVLVTDALAERVAGTNCDGVSFEEPETIGLVNRAPRRRRMAYGVLVVDANLAESAVSHGINTF